MSSRVFAFSRNPMYLGAVILLSAVAVLLCNALACLAIPFFVLYMNRFQIGPEEEALTRIFGDEFAEYKKRVRRWI